MVESGAFMFPRIREKHSRLTAMNARRAWQVRQRITEPTDALFANALDRIAIDRYQRPGVLPLERAPTNSFVRLLRILPKVLEVNFAGTHRISPSRPNREKYRPSRQCSAEFQALRQGRTLVLTLRAVSRCLR